MTGFLIFIHVIICVLLMVLILMQSGRGGGLTENFASVENIFGAKTNETLVRGTTILAAIFFVTCLSLAFLSAKGNKSLMETRRLNVPQAPVTTEAAAPASTTVEPAAPVAASVVPAAQPTK